LTLARALPNGFEDPLSCGLGRIPGYHPSRHILSLRKIPTLETEASKGIEKIQLLRLYG
jgi:hypothetical protein